MMTNILEPSVILRRPTVEDVKELHRLLVESTDGKTKVSASDLHNDLFVITPTNVPQIKIDDPCIEFDYGLVEPDWPIVQAYLAEVDKKAIGHVLYHFHFSPWTGHTVYIDDIFVKPELRGRGIGRRLFNQVSRESIALKIKQCLFQVGRRKPEVESWALNLGARIVRNNQTDWSVYRIDFVES